MERIVFRRDGEKSEDLTVSVDGAHVKVVPISQYIDLRDASGELIATITWPSTTRVKKPGGAHDQARA